MRKLLIAVLVLLCSPAFAVGYSTDFEGAGIGTLPAGWYLFTPWGDWAPGPITADVQAAPGGGKALCIVMGTDWGTYGASSGEAGYTMDMTGIDGSMATLEYSYDMWLTNWRVWRMAGDQSSFPPGGLHMNDDPLRPNQMHVGEDQVPAELLDVPEGAWIHVDTVFDAATDAWTTTVSYATGSGGGIFNGANTNDVVGEIWFGGWAFQSTMDAAPVPPGGVYDNVWYIDNFSMGVTPIPEPGLLALCGLGILALIRRRR